MTKKDELLKAPLIPPSTLNRYIPSTPATKENQSAVGFERFL